VRRTLQQLWKRTDGAVAPTVALSLIGLIAVGGIAFDYARMASLDTELQSAADQAALAAASQLDGETGACTRAVAAAQSLVTNDARFANDAGGLAVTIANTSVCTDDTNITDDPASSVRFYKDKVGTPATTVQEAHFVDVTVNSRRAYYALTPIVGALSSGDESAKARQSEKCFTASAAGNNQSCYLRKASGNQSRSRIRTEAQALDHAGCNGDDVFDCRADFDANDISVCVKPESWRGKFLLQKQSQFFFG